MAKCELRIELDESNDSSTAFRGGETISGKVHVATSAAVQCRKLTVTTGWKTHGKGNVAKEDCHTMTVFEGNWDTGEVVSYPFEVRLGAWPPSYRGHYLNVDHFVEAAADIPWAFDPKTSIALTVRPHRVPMGSESQIISKTFRANNGAVVGLVMTLVLMAISCVFLPLLIVSVPLLLIGWMVYLVKVKLPQWLLGQVELTWQETEVRPGRVVQGALRIKPSRSIATNGITVGLTGTEICVSGHGSNRTTHRHAFFEHTWNIAEASTLQGGVWQDFSIEVPLQEDFPYSMSLPANDLVWQLQTRVDLPRWPDWYRREYLQVVPIQDTESSFDAALEMDDSPIEARTVNGNTLSAEQRTQPPPAGAPAITFAETMQMIQASGSDVDQIRQVVRAVASIQLSATLDVDRRLLYAGDEQAFMNRGETAWWVLAAGDAPAVRMTLFAPSRFTQIWTDGNRNGITGQLILLGYDSGEDRVRARWLG
ncbi:MAG: sporulation protein [Planctomycetota bacterium]